MMSPRTAASLRLPAASILVLSLAIASGAAIARPHIVTPEPPPIPAASGTLPAGNYAVLNDGQQIVANTAEGKIKIEAGPGLRRVFNWDGLRRGLIAEPRTTPFGGGDYKGITYEGTPKVWADAKGITKVHYEEGRRNFENIDDAMIWMQIRRLYFTYNDGGLVIGWKHKGATLQVEVWQFYIDGKLPVSMPDSHSADIAMGALVVEPQKMYPQLVFDDGHTEEYTEETAEKYNTAEASSDAADKSGCNWFQRVFTKSKCEAKAAAAAKAKADAKAEAQAKADAAAQAKRAAAAAAAKAKTPPPQTHPTATISGSTVNIRDSSSTKSNVLFQAKEGDAVEVLKQENKWSYVEFKDGRTGWVADFLLKR